MYANELPETMFSNYTAAGRLIHLVRYHETGLFDGTPLVKWAAHLDKWREGPHFFSHYTDAFRLVVLWKYGGIYIDFDVLLLKVCVRVCVCVCAGALAFEDVPGRVLFVGLRFASTCLFGIRADVCPCVLAS